MSLDFQIIGKPGRDNGMILRINSGNSYYRLLFDCGEDILKELKQSEIKSIDYLFFSHLHIDHIAGFDYFFRRNFDRENQSLFIWGPERTAEIIHHRFLGFNWNLIGEPGSNWYVNDVYDKVIRGYSFKSSEGFLGKYRLERKYYDKNILENKNFNIEAAVLNHRISSLGFRVKENDYLNIDKNLLQRSNLPEGKWIEKVKDFNIDNSEKVIINNEEYVIGNLRDKFLAKTKGESIAYLTDFIFDDESKKSAIDLMKDCNTVVCESQYSAKDIELAKKNHHLTTIQAASLAKEANVKKLILFHISDRYKIEDYSSMLDEARDVFEETYFPAHWDL